jgi:hypothetical protein
MDHVACNRDWSAVALADLQRELVRRKLISSQPEISREEVLASNL